MNLKPVLIFVFTVFLAINISDANSKKMPEISLSEFNKLEKDQYPSLVKTNLHGASYPGSNINIYGANTALYDVSYIVYRSDFAEEHGYPMDEEFIDDTLPKELKVVEFGVKTDGATNRCLMKILVDKSLDIDFPQSELTIRSVRFGDRMRFPKWAGPIEKKEHKDFRMKVRQGDDYRYNMNVLLATHDYVSLKNGIRGKKRGGMNSVVTREFSRKYFKYLNYIKTDIGCTRLTRDILSAEVPNVWIKRKNKKDYANFKNAVSGFYKEDFYRLRLSKKVIEKILPVMEEADKYFRYGGEGVVKINK